MDPVIAEINDLCKTPRYYRWADKIVRLGLAFWHIISLDASGLEIATAGSRLPSALLWNAPPENVQRKSWTGLTSCILSEIQLMFVLVSRRRVPNP
jgi:hypothetical protein